MRPPDDRSATPPAPSDAQFQRFYEELRSLARVLLNGERTGHTLQATALVNEAYLRILKDQPAAAGDDATFQHYAALAMRRVLVEHARARTRYKRGGTAQRIALDALELLCQGQDSDLLAVEEALENLERQDPELAQLVQLRFYAGLSMDEIARVLGRSVRSVHREWSYAKVLLLRELEA